VRWRESTFLSNPKLRRRGFTTLARAAYAEEKGTFGARAFDIGR
jgi:hypothetical protein